MVRVVLAGIGGYADNYIAEFLERPQKGIELVGISDPYASKSPRYEQICAKGIPLYNSLEEFFAKDKADLAVISSPIHTHFDFIECALSNGSSVLCEKPLCTQTEEFIELEKLSKQTKHFIGVGFQQCYSPAIQELKSDIASGMYGKPILLKTLRLMRRGKIYYTRNGWAGKINVHGYPVMDSPLNNACAHEFQNMLFVLGDSPNSTADVDCVSAKLYRANPNIENYDAIALKADSLCRFQGKELHVPLYFYAAHSVEEQKIGPLNQYEFENAFINFDGGFYAVDKKTNEILKDYRKITSGDRLQKFYDCVSCVENGTTPVCTPKTCSVHAKTVSLVQKCPVKRVTGKSLVSLEFDGDSFYVIRNLGKIFTEHYSSATLPDDGEII